MAIDLTLNYSSGEFLEPKKRQNLGEKFNLTETFRRPNAHGGLQRRKYAAVMAIPPALIYGTGLALGINHLLKDKGVMEQSKIIVEHIKTNPKAKETFMKFMAITNPATAAGILKSVTETGLGLDIGDKGEKEAERERILQEEKKKYDDIKWGKREEINVPTDTGTPIPEIKPWEKPKASKPIEIEQEYFPAPKQKTWEEYVYYKKTLGPGHGGGSPGGQKAPQFTKKQKNASLPKEVEVLDKIELKNWIRKTAKEPGAEDNIDLYKAYIKYAKEHGLGSYKAVDKDFKDIFSVGSISALARARGFPLKIKKMEWIGFNKNALTLTEIANKLKKDPNFLDKRLEGVELDKLYTHAEIINFLGGIGKGDQTNLANLIKIKEIGKQGGFITNKPVRTKKIGDKEIYHFGDIIKNLKANAKAKIIPGEGGFAEQSAERTRVNNLLDKELYKFVENIRGTLRSRAQDDDVLYEAIYDPEGKSGEESARWTTDLGHLMPVEWLKKNSKVKFAIQIKDQLYGLNDLVDQHPVVNQRILRKQQGQLTTLGMDIDKFLKKYKGKKWNAESIKEAEKINGTLDTILDKWTKQIQTLAKGDLKLGDTIVKHDPTVAGQEGTLAGPMLDIKPGQTIKVTDVIIDDSRINSEFILGKIDLINPKAVKMSDLSKAEKELYKQAIIDQKMENLFPLLQEAGFTLDDIKTFEEELLYGYGAEGKLKIGDTTIKSGAGKGFLGEEGEVKKFGKYKKRTFKNYGGPVVPTIPYRENFDAGSNPDKKMSDEEILESIRNQVFELEQNWNTEKSIPGKILDVADVTNWPAYAARMLRAGMSVAEISLKLPFVSIELLGKLAQQPAFKVVKTKPDEISGVSEAEIGLKEKFSEGLGESWLTDQPQEKLEGTGLFTEAFHKLMPGTFADKTGLTSLIESQEQAMQDKGMSQWPQIAGKNIEMGLDITLPFGYVAAAQKYKTLKKLLTPLVKDKNVNKMLEKALTDKGMSRRQFNTLLASGGIVATLKALGLDNLFKGMRLAKDIKTVPIKMLKNTSTKMPVWFPKFIENIQKKMTYEGKGMWEFKGTDDFLPGFHIERINDDYYITGKNDYGQEFQVTYESPGWVETGAPSGKGVWNEGEFRVDDAEPIHVDPDGNVDFDGVLREDIDEVLGGTTAMENVATKTTRKSLTKGEEQVIDSEMRYQSEVDVARDEGRLDDLE